MRILRCKNLLKSSFASCFAALGFCADRVAAFLAQALRACSDVGSQKKADFDLFVYVDYAAGSATFTSVPLILNTQPAESVQIKLMACPAPTTTPVRSIIPFGTIVVSYSI